MCLVPPMVYSVGPSREHLIGPQSEQSVGAPREQKTFPLPISCGKPKKDIKTEKLKIKKLKLDNLILYSH